jgi:hypothetical protein
MHSRCALIFFLLSFGLMGWGEHFFFILPLFPTCSLYVTFKFPVSSHQVPKAPNVFPRVFPIASHFIPYVLPKVLPFSPT